MELRMSTFVAELERTRATTLQYFDLPDAGLEKTYGPGKWSVRYVLHHLADSESILYYRIRRVISEPKQVIWAFDQDAWAAKLDYSRVPLALARAIYSSSREGILYHARLHYEGSDRLSFVHSELGLRTLKDEFDKVVWHNDQHLETIVQALRPRS
jgi:hypothetical protein